jgi:hypothetical protein
MSCAHLLCLWAEGTRRQVLPGGTGPNFEVVLQRLRDSSLPTLPAADPAYYGLPAHDLHSLPLKILLPVRTALH